MDRRDPLEKFYSISVVEVSFLALCLRWKPTGRIFKTLSLRWIPTGKMFTDSTTKVDSAPPNGTSDNPLKERLRVKLLLEILVKKCGLEAVKEVMLEEHMKLLTNIRKV
ncbi:hypothetical protein Tco_0336582 [Tanacetum coccineum]